MVGANVSWISWFKKGMTTTAGDQYAVDEIAYDVLRGDKLVAAFSTVVRKDAKEDSRKRSRVTMLDSTLCIVAASDEKRLLLPFLPDHKGLSKQYHVKTDREVIAYAKTLAYQEYDSLEWFAVIVQQP